MSLHQRRRRPTGEVLLLSPAQRVCHQEPCSPRAGHGASLSTRRCSRRSRSPGSRAGKGYSNPEQRFPFQLRVAGVPALPGSCFPRTSEFWFCSGRCANPAPHSSVSHGPGSLGRVGLQMQLKARAGTSNPPQFSFRALDDIRESIKELQFYRDSIFKRKTDEKKRKLIENGESDKTAS